VIDKEEKSKSEENEASQHVAPDVAGFIVHGQDAAEAFSMAPEFRAISALYELVVTTPLSQLVEL